MDGTVIFWQVVAAYVFALAGGGISAAIRISHQALCGLISLAAGTLLGVTLFTLGPEALELTNWRMVGLAAASGYVLFLLISKYVHHVCPACAASHFDADAALVTTFYDESARDERVIEFTLDRTWRENGTQLSSRTITSGPKFRMWLTSSATRWG